MIISSLYRAASRIRSMFSGARLDQDLEEELEIHIEMVTEENIRKGMPPEVARRNAALKVGSRDMAKELHRDSRGIPFLEDLIRDAIYGTRQLRRNPIVTLTAVMTLAIAIGANTAIFTVANALLLRDPAGVADPGRLVDIGVSQKGIGFASSSYSNYRDIAERTTTFEGVYAYPRFPHSMNLTVGGFSGERLYATEVSTNYFRLLGALPAAGRLFDPNDNAGNGGEHSAVLSYPFWTRRFNRSPAVIGQTLRLDDRAYTVIGVTAESFQGTGIRSSDVWLPLRPNMNRAAAALLIGGRLKPGISRAQAAAEMDVIGHALQAEYPNENRDKELRVSALSPLPGETRPVGGFLGLLMGIVAVVLAIACANVSGVLIARAAARRPEIAVRLAIGAGRARIIRQLLTETILLFVISAIIGLALARGLTFLFVSQLPEFPFPIALTISLNVRIVAFAMALSFLGALVSGLAPALQASKGELVTALKNDAQHGLGRSSLRHAFVIAQVALSLLLVVVAGLFVRALQKVSSIDPGFDVRGVELATIDFTTAGYNKVTGAALAHELIGRVRRLPGVEGATIATVLPGGFEGIGLGGLSVPGVTPASDATPSSPTWNVVEPDYFATLHIPLLDGRDFTNNDRTGTQPVVILGEGTARKFWTGERAVGKYIERRSWSPTSQTAESKRLLVIGVVRDPKFGSLVDGTSGTFAYLPLQQEHLQIWTMIAARSVDGRRLTEEIRQAVQSLDSGLTIVSTQTGEDYAALGLAPWRIAASVSGSLGIVGLLLAGIGIYGVTSYLVTRRTREIGIRAALGATRSSAVRMILREGLLLVAMGTAIGMVAAAAAGRLLVTLLFGISPVDPIVFSGAVALFGSIGFVACYLPARRATRIDPMNALRNE